MAIPIGVHAVKILKWVNRRWQFKKKNGQEGQTNLKEKN